MLLKEDFFKEMLNVLSFDKSNEVIDAVKQLIFLQKSDKMELEDEGFDEECKENAEISCDLSIKLKNVNANHVKIANK